MRAALGLLLASSLLASTFSAAQGARRLDDLMQVSGLNAKIATYEKLVLSGVNAGINESVAEVKSKPPTAEESAELKATVGAAFSPVRMRQEVRAALAVSLPPEDEAKVLAFLATPLGKRITAIEVQYSELQIATENARLVRDMQDARKGLTETRVLLLRRLGAAQSMGEVSARMLTGIYTSVMYGVMNAVNLSTKDIDLLKSGLEARKENIAHMMRQGTVARLAHEYKSLDDLELGRFVEFAESPSGLKYYDASLAALEKSVTKASLEFGKQYGEAAKKRKN